MIKVIIGHRVKKGLDIKPFLSKIRENAIQYPGFIADENIANKQDSSVIVVESTWNAIDSWRLWENSKIRTELYLKMKGFLAEEPKVSIYTIVPTHW